MSDNIYEITQMMQSGENFNKEMAEAMELVKNHFHNKYMKRLNRVVQTHQQKSTENPPKEVSLIHAIKPFVHESNHKSIDQAIDMMLMLHSTQSISNELNSQKKVTAASNQSITPATQSVDNTIHEDGIYDLDRVCLANRNTPSMLPGILMLMAMTSR